MTIPASVERQFPSALNSRLVALRRAIHQHPELAFHESETANRLIAALRELGVDDVHQIASTGVVARVRGRNRSAPVVALRGDIDALPIEEATGLPFSSQVPGVMHACGHDVHATWAVAAAALLTQSPAAGDVLIILQPAEETGKGALAVLESGALDGVSAIFGGHVDRRFQVGQVVADEGPLAASADTFEIELVGAGAHGARPHEARDPIVALASIVSALQTIVARRLNPATPGVVTIGTVRAGSAPNIIPERAHLTGTVRAVEPKSRDLMLGEVKRISEAIASGMGVEARVTLDRGTPPIVNPPGATSWARAAATTVLGAENVVPLGFLNLAGEDFAHYMERVPGCFLRIGACEPNGPVIPAHAPKFYAAEESIFVGAAVLAECARVASHALSVSD
ncbi:MAG TPA: M20 family metallopeptidase [Gemmatimonadaceae bacterium]|jgi:amidohydrolase|nr:M20 family metallopeptidase [Gemmatimonadaceae bacterium]